MSKKVVRPEWRFSRLKMKKSEFEKMVRDQYSEWANVVESDFAKQGWASTWQELVDKFADFPDDLIPASVFKALEVYVALDEGRETLNRSPEEAANAAIAATDAYAGYWHKHLLEYGRKQLSEKANAVKREKREKLYALSLDKAKSLADNNPTWNNVQIAEDILKDETYETLSSRELKRRIRANFPDRQHRKKRK